MGRERAGALSLLLRLASALLIRMGSRKRMLLSSLLDSTIPPPSYTCTSMRAKNKMQGGRRAKEARRGVGYSEEEEKDSHLQRCLFAFHTYVYVFPQIWETRKRKQLIAATNSWIFTWFNLSPFFLSFLLLLKALILMNLMIDLSCT